MRLLRVQVPEFRALKDVDISFEPEFTPQVFPLGSLNGGGKSTLLQLIFVLLHCSAHEERHQFIANMLERVTVPEGETSKLLAKFELLGAGEKIELEFILCNDDYLRQLNIDPIFDKKVMSFSLFKDQEKLMASLEKTEAEIENEFLSTGYSALRGDPDLSANEYAKREEYIYSALDHFMKEREVFEILLKEISKCLTVKKQYHITTFHSIDGWKGLLCTFSGSNKTFISAEVLNSISKRIFLSAPPTQIYLFLDKWDKARLFEKTDENVLPNNYQSILDNTKNKLPNFLTHDIFSTDVLISLIEQARNQDFKTLIDSGINGTSYQKMIAEFDMLTQNKRVSPKLDDNAVITGIIFKNNEGIEIYPEDLSHGELKRLSIYAWLKTFTKGENVVLMDEIENGFHPDWQRHIVDDLVEWGPSNQFILATHSYELCWGVTPAHVKELLPNLFS